AIKDLRVNTPFQRIRASLLLLMQVLILLLLAFALMRPFLSLESRDAKLIVILIDNSASMNTVDAHYNGDVVTRLEMARGKALESIRHLNANDIVMVAEFNQRPRTMQSFTNVRASIERAIRDIQPTDLRTDFKGAMTEIQETINTKRASLPVNETRHPYLKLYTDGEFVQDDLDIDPALLDNFQFIQCGEVTTNNVGITALNVRRSLVSGVRDPLQAFFTIENFAAEPRTFQYKLLLNGEVLEAVPGQKSINLTLAGRPQAGDPGAPPTTGIAERPWRKDVMLALQPDKYGALEIKLDINDNLAADNSAVVDVPRPENTRILVVMATDANLFLQRALEAIRKERASKTSNDFLITYKTPEEFEAAYGKDQPENGPVVHITDYDVAIFYNYAPKFHAGISSLYFGAIPHLAGYTPHDPVDFPVIVDTNRSHTVTRFINMIDVPVAKAIRYDFPRSAEVLIRGQHGVIGTADDDGRFRTVVVAMDLWDGMWLLHYSFPLFVHAAIDYLTGASERAGGQSQHTGDALTLPPVSEPQEINLVDPTGTSHPLSLAVTNPVYYADTRIAGMYKYQAKKGDWNYFGVNLANPAESDNAALSDIHIKGHGPIRALDRSKENREIWPYLVMAMLVLLVLEWLVYHRQWSN
ncbi:MAG TPA: VWA domain-containing protein, partial [Planctomycetota bacterium]|nr:VWA domain-containing protein [Planctomycetota bacterium]